MKEKIGISGKMGTQPGIPRLGCWTMREDNSCNNEQSQRRFLKNKTRVLKRERCKNKTNERI